MIESKQLTRLTSCILLLFISLFSLQARSADFWQDRTRILTGKVSNEKGEAISGASVIIPGSSAGTETNTTGDFEWRITDTTSEIIITSVGYEDTRVSVKNKTLVLVTMIAKSNVLNDVVVTGYSTQRKKDIIGAVSIVTSKDLGETPSANVVAQLQGKAPGVIVSTSGDPGTTAGIRIRGFASYGNNNPLYIIDGVATTDMSRINSEDIESLQVLKDATSASIYGARAANGVIIITTKHGKANRTTMSYDGYIGFQKLPGKSIPSMLTPVQDMQYLTLTQTNTYVDPVFGAYGSFSIPDYYIVSNNFKGGVSASDPRANPALYTIADQSNIYQILKPPAGGTDWFRAMTQTALMHSHQVSVSGGGDRSNFYFGLNYLNQDGIFKYTGYNRYSVRMNSSFKPTDYFSLGENLQVSFDNRTGQNSLLGEGNAWSDAYRSSSFVPVHDIK